MLGNAYEYLIKHFADLTNKKAGEFYTPRSVVHLLGLILDPHEGETIYDPACGTGGTRRDREKGRLFVLIRRRCSEKAYPTPNFHREILRRLK